jgi:hypothetical protein
MQTTWTPANADGPHGTATAYTHSSGARLAKGPKRWTLTIGAKAHTLGKQATFDHAEALIAAFAGAH